MACFDFIVTTSIVPLFEQCDNNVEAVDDRLSNSVMPVTAHCIGRTG